MACPISTGVFTEVASTVILLGTLSTGGVESFTVTFCVPELELPFESVAVQITLKVPTVKPSFGALFVIVTAKISDASASPNSTGVLSPVASIITSGGTLITGAVVSTIFIF